MEHTCNTAYGGLGWEATWRRGVARNTNFDKACAHPALAALVRRAAFGAAGARAGRALVPGCGRGYEVLALAGSGAFDRVVGLDVAPTAIAAAGALRDAAGGEAKAHSELVCEDFFRYARRGAGFRVAVDYTFFCALPPALRTEWAQAYARLIDVGGVLVALMHPLVEPGAVQEKKEPPYWVSFALYEELLTSVGFEALGEPEVLPDELCHHGRGDGRSGIGRWVRVEDKS